MKAIEIDRKIEALQADIEALKRTRALLYGELESVLRSAGRRIKSSESDGTGRFWLKADSAPALAQAVLKEAGKPMHITEIVGAVRAMSKGKHFPAAYIKQAVYVAARKGKIFKREGGGRFGLLEWDRK